MSLAPPSREVARSLRGACPVRRDGIDAAPMLPCVRSERLQQVEPDMTQLLQSRPSHLFRHSAGRDFKANMFDDLPLRQDAGEGSEGRRVDNCVLHTCVQCKFFA